MFRKPVILSLAIFAIISCANINNPSKVANKFWNALSAKNFAQAKEYAVTGTMDDTSISEDAELKIIKIEKKARIENDLAYIPTKIEVVNNGEIKSYNFETVLTKENNLWKVDFVKTQTSMIGFSVEQFEKNLKEAGKEMGQAMGEAMKEMGKAMGDAMEEMAEKTQEALEKHKNKSIE